MAGSKNPAKSFMYKYTDWMYKHKGYFITRQRHRLWTITHKGISVSFNTMSKARRYIDEQVKKEIECF